MKRSTIVILVSIGVGIIMMSLAVRHLSSNTGGEQSANGDQASTSGEPSSELDESDAPLLKAKEYALTSAVRQFVAIYFSQSPEIGFEEWAQSLEGGVTKRFSKRFVTPNARDEFVPKVDTDRSDVEAVLDSISGEYNEEEGYAEQFMVLGTTRYDESDEFQDYEIDTSRILRVRLLHTRGSWLVEDISWQ